MKRKPTDWVNKLLKISIIILILLLILILLRDFNLFKLTTAKNINQTNQIVHNLQLEFEAQKVTNVSLIKHIASQQARISELETLQTNIVEHITIPEPTTVRNVPVNAPETQPSSRLGAYLEYIPHEMIIITTGALYLLRQMIFPKYATN